jgi:peroxiredoxin
VLAVGQPAPDFALGGGSTLRDLLRQGPVVVWFFPKAFTSG